jgi:hypothetical protein
MYKVLTIMRDNHNDGEYLQQSKTMAFKAITIDTVQVEINLSTQ